MEWPPILLAPQACAIPRTAFGFANPTRDLRMACRLSTRNLAQGLPDPLREVRAANVERQVEADVRRLNRAHERGDEFFEAGIASDEVRVRETIL